MVGVCQREEYNILNDIKLFDDISNAFIKKFKTDKNFYIYDVNTNEFLKVDEVVWGVFPNDETRKNNISRTINKWGEDKVSKALSEIKDQMAKDRLFSSNRPKICMTMTQEHLEEHIRHKNEQTILNITEDCNFRCKYCIYSGIYKHIRTHSKKYMTWETAKAAMDDFLVNSSETIDSSLSFYGGEPILAIDMIKKCVEYIKEKGKKCHFNITTNGSLLDEKNIRYFIDNNFLLSISLNGPKEIHDLYRVYISGAGTWENVNSNIEMIRRINSEYFTNNLNFICTFLPLYKIKNIINYFNEKRYGNSVKFSTVDQNNTDYFKANFSKSQLEDDYNNQFSLMFEEYINLFKKQNTYNSRLLLLSDIFESFPVLYHKRPSYVLSDTILSQGMCFMGGRRLFVDTEGNYFPCERVNKQYPIGNVISGIDYMKIYKYMSVFNDYQSEFCYGCPYVRFCIKCIKSIFNKNRFNKKRFQEVCMRNFNKINYCLVRYLELLETDHEALNKLACIEVR